MAWMRQNMLLLLKVGLVTISAVDGAFSIDETGYFRNGTQLFVPVGVNYWPGSVGSEMWYGQFPKDEIRRDFGIVRATGFNAVRIFLTWPIFQPQPGKFNQTAFDNFRHMMEFAREERLAVDVSVFVGGMSGGIYWPSWVKGNIYTDETTKEEMVAFALKVAQAVAPFRDILLALEHGNEMNNVGTSPHSSLPVISDPNLTTAEVVAWTQAIYNAFKEGCPGVPVVPGVGDGSIIRDTAWPLGGPTGRVAADTLNFHPYAVLFEPTRGDGLLDPMTHATTGYNAAFVRAHGPAFMQEWGTLVTGGPRQTETYLRGTLPAAWANGANGFLWWCMRDITNTAVDPYNTHGKETLLGLYDGQSNRLKPGHEFLAEFAQQLTSLTEPPHLPEQDPSSIGLYLPAHHYLRDDPSNPGNEPGTTVMSATIAYHLLRLLNRTTHVVRGAAESLPKPRKELRTLVVTSSFLTTPELVALRDWVEAGGHLLWHGVPPSAFTQEGPGAGETAAVELVGASCGGSLASERLSVSIGGQQWNLSTDFRVGKGIPGVAAAALSNITADRTWRAADGTPVATLNTLGQGRVFASVLPVEASIDPVSSPATRDRWTSWYGSTLACLEDAACDIRARSPTVEPPLRRASARVHKSTVKRRPAARTVAVYSSGDSKDAATSAKAKKALTDAGHEAVILSSPLVLPSNVSTVVLPSQVLVLLPDQEILSKFVKNGGCLLWDGISFSAISAVGFDIIGAVAVDYRSPEPSTFEVFGQNWTMDKFPSRTPVHVEFDTVKSQRKAWGMASKLATDQRGIATTFLNLLGEGTAITATPAVEKSLSASALSAWYNGALGLCHAEQISV